MSYTFSLIRHAHRNVEKSFEGALLAGPPLSLMAADTEKVTSAPRQLTARRRRSRCPATPRTASTRGADILSGADIRPAEADDAALRARPADTPRRLRAASTMISQAIHCLQAALGRARRDF